MEISLHNKDTIKFASSDKIEELVKQIEIFFITYKLLGYSISFGESFDKKYRYITSFITFSSNFEITQICFGESKDSKLITNITIFHDGKELYSGFDVNCLIETFKNLINLA